jgi:hypothetical protein
MNNPTDDLEEIFDSVDLYECLDYFETYDDIEPLRRAISFNSQKLREAKDELELLRDTAGAGGRLSFYENKAQKIINILKR